MPEGSYYIVSGVKTNRSIQNGYSKYYVTDFTIYIDSQIVEKSAETMEKHIWKKLKSPSKYKKCALMNYRITFMSKVSC